MQGGHRRQAQAEDPMEDCNGGAPSLDLALVGRHALLFDDDAAAAFANSPASLLPWNGDDSLLMDRFDVRHLLQDLSGIRKRRPPPPLLDCTQGDLDFERFRDLEGIDQEEEEEENGRVSSLPSEGSRLEQGDYRSLPYSYSEEAPGGEKVAESAIADFRPTFSVPGYLLPKLPPTEKLHQIIAGTAKFVSGHGGQSEIILRVKQGHNPVFGFLNPGHHLHEYFRYLVEHPELVGVGKHLDESAKSTAKGASEGLSLLGTIYGDDDDEADLGALIGMEEDKSNFDFGKDLTNLKAEVDPTKVDLTKVDSETEVIASGSGLQSSINVSSENQAVSDASGLSDEPPPVAVKQAVQKMVEFIIRNGKDFEAIAKEKDKKYGRFQFLLPWNKYHSYYLKSLEAAQKSAMSKQVGTVKDDTEDTSQECNRKKPESSIAKPNGHVRHWLHGGTKSGVDTEEADDNSLVIRAPLSSFNQEKKKLKIVIGGKKEISSFGDGEDPAGMSADAAAAAVKLATSRYRSGLKSESSDHSLKTDSINGMNLGLSEDAAAEAVMAAIRGLKKGKKKKEEEEEGRLDSVFVSVSGLHERVVKSLAESSERSIASGSYNLDSVPSASIDDISLAKVAARAAVLAASCEADSADTQLTAEQKLKAERLRRAKMFTALIKGGGHNIADSVSNRGDNLTSAVMVEGNIAETSNRDTDAVQNGEAHNTSSKEHQITANGNNTHTSSKEYRDKHRRHRHEKRESRHERDDNKSGRSKRSHDSHRSKDVDEKDAKSHRRRKMDDCEKESEYSKRSHHKRGSPRDDYSIGKSHKHRESSSNKQRRLESKDVKDRSSHPRVEPDTQKTKIVEIQELQITATADADADADADANANANANADADTNANVSSMSVEEIPDHLRAKIRAILFA